jgi:hypothetical protein
VTAGFALSYTALCGVQAATAALPRAHAFRRLEALEAWAWAIVPAACIVVTVAAIAVLPGVADGLTYLALAAVPPLAAVALGWAARGARLPLAVLAVPLLVVTIAAQGSFAGELAGTLLEALSCVTLACLIAAVAPRLWLRAGIVVMAVSDAILILSHQLQQPNALLVAATPGSGLPQLQRSVVGSAVMGYGDLFAAALLGATLAAERRSGRGALALLVFGIAFGGLFWVLDELPATVPVALALGAATTGSRRVKLPGSRA